MTQYDPAAAGWRTMPGAALPSGIGIPWARRVDGLWHYGLLTDDDHGNANGVVHGGVLMAFADHGLSMLAWVAAEHPAPPSSSTPISSTLSIPANSSSCAAR